MPEELCQVKEDLNFQTNAFDKHMLSD